MIATKGRPRLVREAVESVLAGSVRPAEILVVDQGAEAGGLAFAQPPEDTRIRIVTEPARGLSAARNRGIAEAAHEAVVLIDDDVLVASDWLRELLGGLVDAGERAVATGRVVPGEAEAPGAFVPAAAPSTEPATYRGRIRRDVLAGGNMAAWKRDLVAVGLFDERLGPGTAHPAAEDNDLGLRLLEAGCRIAFVPGAAVTHRAWRGGGDYLPTRWRYGRGKGGFYAKHLSLADRYMLGRASGDVGKRLARLPGALVRRRRLAAGDAAYTAGVVAGMVSWAAQAGARRARGS